MTGMDENPPVATPFDESYPDKFARLAEALAAGDASEAYLKRWNDATANPEQI